MPFELAELFFSERERWAYWLPVLLAGGIGVYFLLPVEPWPGVGPLLVLATVALLFRLRGHPLGRAFLLAALAGVLGFAAAQLRTGLVYAPMLDRPLSPVQIEGTVQTREILTDGVRLLLGDLQIERLSEEQTPQLVRITFRHRGQGVAVGQRIRVLVNLLPPMEPSYPGGYNFRRDAFYQQIGAYGIALRDPQLIPAGESGSLTGRAEQWRESVAAYITATIPGAEGAIAAALMTGERGAIDDTTNANMRAAGTAHLLSISGMHIGMVGGFVFFLFRALLALVPVLALRFAIKKWAAILALMVVLAYTWLVGAPIPAQRSALMAGLVFMAILLDRQAITMRAVALAAGSILLIFPESLLSPGFQLSFAAIVMLVAAYEWAATRQVERGPVSWLARGWRYVAGIAVTSLIAGFATMPYGAWHFHRLQLLGLLGNLIAVPATGILVMPSAVVAYALLPLGLAAPALAVMQWGLQIVTSSAGWVATLPFANLILPQFSLAALLIITLGGLWLALWQSRLRWLGVPCILLGAALVPFGSHPVVLVSPEGKLAILEPGAGLAVPRLPARGQIYETWGLAFAYGRAPRNWEALSPALWQCDRSGCVYRGRHQSIAFPRHLAAALADCQRADIVIAPTLRLPSACRNAASAPLVIDRRSLRTSGAVMVLDDGEIITSRRASTRPWQPYYQRFNRRPHAEKQALSDTSGSGQQAAPEP